MGIVEAIVLQNNGARESRTKNNHFGQMEPIKEIVTAMIQVNLDIIHEPLNTVINIIFSTSMPFGLHVTMESYVYRYCFLWK